MKLLRRKKNKYIIKNSIIWKVFPDLYKDNPVRKII